MTEKQEMEAPKSFQEFRNWYKEKGLPPEYETRCFIGQDSDEPLGFGVYKDCVNECFVYYKNRLDGSKQFVYRSQTIADVIFYAYETLLSKYSRFIEDKQFETEIEEEIKKRYEPEKVTLKKIILTIVFFAIGISLFIFTSKNPEYKQDGYYEYEGRIYYKHAENWFLYGDEFFGWTDGKNYRVTFPEELKTFTRKDEHFITAKWKPELMVTDWEKSTYAYIYKIPGYERPYDPDIDNKPSREKILKEIEKGK